MYFYKMERGGYVYIMTNKKRTTLYIGVTSALYWRVLEHKTGKGSIFTSKYKCYDLIYFETFTSIEEAIQREKTLKNWKRKWKLNMIRKTNPEMIDLTETVKDYI